MVAHSVFDFLLYLMLYAFLAWVIEVCWYSVKDGRFINRGFINLPFRLPYGIAFALLIQVLPTLGRNYVLQFIVTLAVLAVVRSLTGTFTYRVILQSRLKQARFQVILRRSSFWRFD